LLINVTNENTSDAGNCFVVMDFHFPKRTVKKVQILFYVTLEAPRFYGFWSHQVLTDGSHSIVGSGYRRYYRDYYNPGNENGFVCQGCVCDVKKRFVRCNESTASTL